MHAGVLVTLFSSSLFAVTFEEKGGISLFYLFIFPTSSLHKYISMETITAAFAALTPSQQAGRRTSCVWVEPGHFSTVFHHWETFFAEVLQACAALDLLDSSPSPTMQVRILSFVVN